MSDRVLKALGALWESWGGVWGGKFDDPIHFEFPGFPHAVAPSDTPSDSTNLVSRVANAYNDLPWYLQLLTPATAATERLTPGTHCRTIFGKKICLG